MNHDNYDMQLLKTLQRIAKSLEHIAKMLEPIEVYPVIKSETNHDMEEKE